MKVRVNGIGIPNKTYLIKISSKLITTVTQHINTTFFREQHFIAICWTVQLLFLNLQRSPHSGLRKTVLTNRRNLMRKF